MPEVKPQNKNLSPDWFVRGILTRIGDIFDRLTGRGWKPSSSLATSELVERLKALLDAEAEKTDRGVFVPHNIQLKMQWDKFSADSEESLQKLENELLTAAVDHINDRRYYTYQPLAIEAKPDYFTSGVKLFVSFDKHIDDEEASAMNVIVAGQTAQTSDSGEAAPEKRTEKFILHFIENGKPKALPVEFVENVRKSVGRTKENDITIDDANISKLHAALVLNADGQLLVADTGSTNGTFVNGSRIAYGKAEPLNTGDKVNFGTVEVRFEYMPKPMVEPQIEQPAISPTQAETVAINGFEFTSKAAEQPLPPTQGDIEIPASDE